MPSPERVEVVLRGRQPVLLRATPALVPPQPVVRTSVVLGVLHPLPCDAPCKHQAPLPNSHFHGMASDPVEGLGVGTLSVRTPLALVSTCAEAVGGVSFAAACNGRDMRPLSCSHAAVQQCIDHLRLEEAGLESKRCSRSVEGSTACLPMDAHAALLL